MTMEICWEGCWAGVVWMDNSSEGGSPVFHGKGGDRGEKAEILRF